MYSPKPPDSLWRRVSLRGPVAMDKYERVPLMEEHDSPKISHSANIQGDDDDDKDPLLPPPIVEKKKKEEQSLRNWGDMTVVFLVLLLSETARGIVLPTLSPYVHILGGTATLLGYAVAAFSVGRFASTIGLGYLSTTLSYKKVLGASVAISVVGNFMYSFSYFWGPYFLLASRFVTGFGAGTLSVIRAYVAHVTTTKERTKFMSILGAVQFFGFAIMPGAGSLLSYIPPFYIAGAPFDKYTLPGYVLGITSLALLLLIIFEFSNPPPLITQVDGARSAAPTPTTEPRSPLLGHPPPPPPASPDHLRSPPIARAPLVPAYPSPPGTHVYHHSPHIAPVPPYYHPQSPHFAPPPPVQPFPVNFSPVLPHSPAILVSPHFQAPAPASPHLRSPRVAHSPRIARSEISSPHSPVSRSQSTSEHSTPPSSPPPSPPTSGPTKMQKILIFGVFLVLNLMVRLVLGIIETIATPVYIELNNNKSGKDVEAGFVFGGLGLIGMGVLFLISYLSKFIEDFKILVSGLCAMVLGSGLLIGDLQLWRFILGCGLIWCIGYPLAQTIIVSMFSKMLGSKPQGTWMGWIGAMGSLGRIIGPAVSGVLLDRVGQSATMIFGTAVAVVSLLTSMLLLTVKAKHS